MVAHTVLNVLNRQQTVRLHIQRHRLLGRIALNKVGVLIHCLIVFTEERPYACFTTSQCAEVVRAIGLLETEVFIFSTEIPFFAGQRNNIGRIHTIFLVIERNLLDARLVGMCRDAIIRNTDGHPNSPFVTRAFTDQFHHPCFVLVGDRESLAAAVITVVLHQVGHYFDCFAGRL